SLRQTIEGSTQFEPAQKASTLDALTGYEVAGQELMGLDNQIQNLRSGFDLQATAIEPLSNQLIELAAADVDQARRQIDDTSQLATILLTNAVLVAVALAIVIALVLNNSITRN